MYDPNNVFDTDQDKIEGVCNRDYAVKIPQNTTFATQKDGDLDLEGLMKKSNDELSIFQDTKNENSKFLGYLWRYVNFWFRRFMG